VRLFMSMMVYLVAYRVYPDRWACCMDASSQGEVCCEKCGDGSWQTKLSIPSCTQIMSRSFMPA